MERVDCIVVGAGVVGLAVARALAQSGREVIVVEAKAGIGTGVSSRNSEVIHAGIYYPPGSLKARLCVEGGRRLHAYCAERGIAHRRCGKLVVATADAQRSALAHLHANGLRNGVPELALLAREEACALEPALECVAALHCPGTGIVDSRALMLALQADAEQAGAVCAFGSPVTGGAIAQDGIVIETGGTQPAALVARAVINCAALGAQRIAHGLRGFPAARVPAAHYAKGSYFALAGRAPFAHLIYPVPEPAGLGVHLTLDLGGQAKFGPDVEWVAPDAAGRFDYRVDPVRGERFYAEVRKYWPALADVALRPAYAGVRPKISGPGATAADFLILGPREHGVAGLVHLFGIESPGLTAALALADEAVARLAD